ncbi:MAG: serine/threonine-protein phosphatase [Myxococcota bacterium]|jgi:serine/threonine protein phosphatase PrpC|nr:serine/threonine-protein phosphatase [Myxococcota bacterium]
MSLTEDNEEQPEGAPKKRSDPLLARDRSLEEHTASFREAHARGKKTCSATLAVFQGVTAALAREFQAGSLLFRLLPEDVVYDPDLAAFAVAADIARYSLDKPAPKVTLLDNGIFAPEATGHSTRPVSARTMVHNLAALIYYTVAGLAPTPGFLRLAARDLPPIRTFVPDLPLGLDPMLRQAVHLNPEKRHPDPLAFSDCLAQLLAHDEERQRRAPDDLLMLKFASSTHPGIQKSLKNPVNQDHHLCLYDAEKRLGLFVVADGVSTCHFGSGERAALLTVQAAELEWKEMLEDPALDCPPSQRDSKALQGHLKRLLARANKSVVTEMTNDYPNTLQAGSKIMSSTAAVLLLSGSQAWLANLGDSRIYLFNRTLYDQLTVDLDKRTSLLRHGKGLDEILNSSGLGELMSNVGRITKNAAGKIVPEAMRPEISTLNLLPGDRLLICSDGIPDCIGSDAEPLMQEIICKAKRPTEAAWELLVAANQRGGMDNLTAIVIDCQKKEH